MNHLIDTLMFVTWDDVCKEFGMPVRCINVARIQGWRMIIFRRSWEHGHKSYHLLLWGWTGKTPRAGLVWDQGWGRAEIPQPDLTSVLSAVWTQQTDLHPPAAWEVWVKWASVVAWHYCLVQHIRQKDLSCSEISFQSLSWIPFKRGVQVQPPPGILFAMVQGGAELRTVSDTW